MRADSASASATSRSTTSNQRGEGGTRLTVYVDRVRDPAIATRAALMRLLTVRRDLVREVESCASEQNASASEGGRAAAAEQLSFLAAAWQDEPYRD